MIGWGVKSPSGSKRVNLMDVSYIPRLKAWAFRQKFVRNHTADVGGSNPSRHIKTDLGGGCRMCMLSRDDIRKTSYLKGYVQIEVDSSLINSIEHEVRNYISIGKDLYETQEQIKDFLIHKYGKDWYLKSGNAINYIIENEYSIYFYNESL